MIIYNDVAKNNTFNSKTLFMYTDIACLKDFLKNVMF